MDKDIWISHEPDLEGTYTLEDLKDMYNTKIDKESQDGYPDFDSWLYDMEKLGILVKENKEKVTEIIEEKYIKSYNETDYGYHNNATMIYGELKDRNWYVYIPDNDVIDIYNTEITEKFIDTSYNYDTDDERADDEWYNKFVEEHRITKTYNTDDLHLIISELDQMYFGEEFLESKETEEFEKLEETNNSIDKILKHNENVWQQTINESNKLTDNDVIKFVDKVSLEFKKQGWVVNKINNIYSFKSTDGKEIQIIAKLYKWPEINEACNYFKIKNFNVGLILNNSTLSKSKTDDEDIIRYTFFNKDALRDFDAEMLVFEFNNGWLETGLEHNNATINKIEDKDKVKEYVATSIYDAYNDFDKSDYENTDIDKNVIEDWLDTYFDGVYNKYKSNYKDFNQLVDIIVEVFWRTIDGEEFLESKELKIENETKNNYIIYQYEVGVLLDKDHEEYASYNTVYDNQYSFYDEDWGVFADYEDVKTYVDNYVKDGVVNTYGIISEITVDKDLYSDTLNQDDNHHAMDSDMFYEMDYDPTYIIYSIYKNDNNELVQNFISLNQEKIEEIKNKKAESDNNIKYNIYILEGEDGVYNSQLIDTVDSEEQAEDRVAELSAETGSNAYYKKVINGKEEDEDEWDSLEEEKEREITYNEEDNKKLKEIYDNLQNNINYGYDMTNVTFPVFHSVLYLVWNDKAHTEKAIGWNHYGSSANKNTLEDLKWVLDNIFEMTPTEFLNTYIKEQDSKIEESKELKTEWEDYPDSFNYLEDDPDDYEEEPFSGYKFEKNLPMRMHYKQWDIIYDESEDIFDLYWVTQQFFGQEELNEFIKALKELDRFDKAYVTVRDLSKGDFKVDLERNVLVKIELNTETNLPYVDATGYKEAMKDGYDFDFESGEWKS